MKEATEDNADKEIEEGDQEDGEECSANAVFFLIGVDTCLSIKGKRRTYVEREEDRHVGKGEDDDTQVGEELGQVLREEELLGEGEGEVGESIATRVREGMEDVHEDNNEGEGEGKEAEGGQEHKNSNR